MTTFQPFLGKKPFKKIFEEFCLNEKELFPNHLSLCMCTAPGRAAIKDSGGLVPGHDADKAPLGSLGPKAAPDG